MLEPRLDSIGIARTNHNPCYTTDGRWHRRRRLGRLRRQLAADRSQYRDRLVQSGALVRREVGVRRHRRMLEAGAIGRKCRDHRLGIVGQQATHVRRYDHRRLAMDGRRQHVTIIGSRQRKRVDSMLVIRHHGVFDVRQLHQHAAQRRGIKDVGIEERGDTHRRPSS